MQCIPFHPVSTPQVYAGNILDTDVDQSLLGLGEWEGKEGVSRDRDEKLTVTTKTEKGSMLSTSSSSAYTSVNASCPLNSKCSDAIRDREEGTAQMEESYTYGSCRKTSHPPPAPHPGPSSCVSKPTLCDSKGLFHFHCIESLLRNDATRKNKIVSDGFLKCTHPQTLSTTID